MPSSDIWQACYRCLPGGGQAGNNTAQPGVMRRGSPGGQSRRKQGQPCRCYSEQLSVSRRRCCPGEAAAGGARRRLGPADVSHTGPGEAAPRGTPRPPPIQAGCLPALQVLLQDGQALGLLAVVGDHGAGALDDLQVRMSTRQQREPSTVAAPVCCASAAAAAAQAGCWLVGTTACPGWLLLGQKSSDRLVPTRKSRTDSCPPPPT